MSTIFHSVLLLDEMIAILSFFWTPNCIKALEIALALAIYSSVDVLIHFPSFFSARHFKAKASEPDEDSDKQ